MIKKILKFLYHKLKDNFFIRKVIEFLAWMESKSSTRLKERISKKLSPKHKDIIKKILSPSKGHSKLRLQKMRHRLYSIGFVDRQLKELESFIKETKNDDLKKLATWELVLWYSSQNNKESAAKCVDLLSTELSGKHKPINLYETKIIEAENYIRLNNYKEAKKAISKGLEGERQGDLYLAASNVESDINEQQKYINHCLKLYGLVEININSSKDKLPFYSISNHMGNDQRDDDSHKVSIIVPVNNAESYLRNTLDSIIHQTWRNFEAIIIDDGSTDNTANIVEDYIRKDSRFKLISLSEMAGQYEARNHGLKISNGDFVTVFNSNEWAHPQKLEKQIDQLISNQDILGNTSQNVWTDNYLHFFRQKNESKYTVTNTTSFMFRLEHVKNAIGYWDTVNYCGDIEFIQRVKKVFGESSVKELEIGPLTLKKIENDYYNDYNFAGSNQFYIGAQKEYVESYTHFHLKSDSLYYSFGNKERIFPVPNTLLTKVNKRRHFDVIIASDFRLVGGSTMSNIEEIKAHKKIGVETGLIQISRYDVDPTKEVNDKVRDQIDGDKVNMLVYGEKVSCDLLIVRYPPILQEWQKFIPDVKTNNIRIIINQPPMSDYGPNAVLRYNLKQSQQNVINYFGKEGVWHPIGPLVREALHEHHERDLPLINLSKEDWSNIIDLDEWKRSKRREKSAKIRIGRHSRDHEVKWPERKNDFLSIYPDSEEFQIYILGGAVTPRRIVGRTPNNWCVYEFGELHPKEFLAELDVFVYYTHSDWVESFGRVIIEAMAVGVPVVLPHSYSDLFEEAAIYAEIHEVKDKILMLMNDPQMYDNQVQRAFEYVESKFGYKMHATRLKKYGQMEKITIF
ncbi:glycosyltransferase [Evansella sp. AB-P1]|uniref:glycosyltransferase n=1 Tax=Evansella sp. AB-P1 TaxID=3037653 RepID=UPI00241CD760|nr:glycosyltransferase [Evansella sp. AB-P1]MDG5786698.1 glycosyltransferase [Evansella sp. AB-P1]